MKALSLTQPWATAIMLGVKTIETRSWSTNYRGIIAIHAAAGFPKYARQFAEQQIVLGRLRRQEFPLGVIIGFVNLASVKRTEEVVSFLLDSERDFGDYTPGRFAWMFDKCHPLPTDRFIRCKGSLGLWTVPAGLVENVA